MKTRGKLLLLTAFFTVVVPLIVAMYLVMALTSTAWGLTQVYQGDGAINNGAGGWTNTAPAGYCLSCHGSGGSALDMSAYLFTGHKNMLKKVTLFKPWTFSDGSPLFTTDTPAGGSLYNSGSIFDWMNAKITVGSGPDLPFPPDPFAGTVQDIFYQFGGWVDPTQLDTIWRGGFTGEQFASGNYDCARCHTAGYQFDNLASEPTDSTGAKISTTDFMRVPTDYDPADPLSPNASWQQDGITCERCHVANDGSNNHTLTGGITGGIPTKPTGTAATALCMECHRTEIVDTVAHTITFDTGQYVQDGGGGCSDGVTLDYTTCISITGNTWDYAPFLDHESGLSFLNSPHARFTGTVALNVQNSSDLSMNLAGTYNSAFTNVDSSQGGCTTCHDPHQSFTQASAIPLKKNCNDCHTTKAQNILSLMKHPTGANTPFPTGTAADIPGSCQVCHMPQGYHFMRISTDSNYSTFPTVSQFYNAGQTTANTASDGKISGAVWMDVNYACGQCHVGDGSSGTTTPVTGAPLYDKVTLVGYAACIHNDLTVSSVTAGADANGSISPSGTITVNSGDTRTFTIAPDAGYQVQSVIVDGASVGPVTSYTISNITGCHTIIAYFKGLSYTITATAGTGGSISPPGVNTVKSGGDMIFTITPSAGYTTADVKVDGVSQGTPGTVPFFNVTSNHTISATFNPNTSYNITASAGANGSISPSGIVPVLGGTNQKFTMTPAAGYAVADVQVDGTSVGALTSYTFYNVQAAHTIGATFAKYTITATANVNGSIAPSGSQTVSAGANITFTITANPGYQVLSVNVDGANQGALTSYTFTNVSANHTINAYFKAVTYTITASAGANGSISPAGTLTFNPGTNQTFTITPAAGYHIADVQVDGSSVGAPTSYPFANITANHTISATFAVNSSYTITASADANSTISPVGTVNVPSGANQKFTITPAAGYRIADVLVDGTSVGARTSYTFYNVTAVHTISVSSTLDVYTITATANTGGSISPSGTITLNPGATQTFTITPDPGHAILSVFVDGANWGAKTSFTFTNIRANHTISAYFK